MKFLENDNYYRPLNMAHGIFGYRLWHPYFWAMIKAKKTLKKHLEMGYGGVVVNTYNGKKPKTQVKHYLTDERTFKYLRGVIRLCKEMGLRVWLYDEIGYPSGGALGKVVKQMPEAECYGIICNPHPLKKGESISLSLPYGHEGLKAVLFDDGNEIKNITEMAEANGDITYTADADGSLYYIASKVLYEGVHPSRKFAENCRYIDLMDKKAVSKFLEMTFENYTKYIGEFFGNTVEAVFTDEPSVMNQYFSELEYKKPPFEVDKIDNSIPFYKFIAWSRNFENEFLNRKGYDITPNIPKLFESGGDAPSKIKQDYYEVCRDLYREAFFEQYAEFCERLGLKLSGHLLGEECLENHIINELDFFDTLKHMHYPGIDVLSCSEVDEVKNESLLLKTVSSVAALEDRPIVMSETGMHFDDIFEITKEKTLCTLMIQYACGINTITTYMKKWESAEEKKYCFDRVSRAGQLLESGKFYSELLVYYPVKSGYAFNTPSVKGHNERDYDPVFEKICKGFNNDVNGLCSAKVTYTIANSSYLSGASAEGGRLSVGKCLPFKAMYIPYCFIEAEGIEEAILNIARAGVKIFVSSKAVLTPALKKAENLIFVDDAEQIKELLYRTESADVIFNGDAEKVVYCRKISAEGETLMFVNASDKAVEFGVKLRGEKRPMGYDLTDNTDFTPACEKSGEYQSVSLSLSPYQTKFLIL